MAKTTSQIVAENKKKRAEEEKIRASRDQIDQRQLADVEHRLVGARFTASTPEEKQLYENALRSYDENVRSKVRGGLLPVSHRDRLLETIDKMEGTGIEKYYAYLEKSLRDTSFLQQLEESIPWKEQGDFLEEARDKKANGEYAALEEQIRKEQRDFYGTYSDRYVQEYLKHHTMDALPQAQEPEYDRYVDPDSPYYSAAKSFLDRQMGEYGQRPIEEPVKPGIANAEAEDETAYQGAIKNANAHIREKNRLDYVQKYTGKEYQDNFWGQFGGNYTIGRLSQDSSLAWNEYLDNPTEENRLYAQTIDQLVSEVQINNPDVFVDEGTLSIISKDLANYIPQLADQIKYEAGGAVAGAAAGFAVAGTTGYGPAIRKGIKAGVTAASGVYSYQTMRGAAFKSLLEAGADEETARMAANNEAIISSAIEMGETAIRLALTGGGKAIDAVSSGSVAALKKQISDIAGKNVATKFMTIFFGYLANIGSESLEEATQESVSIANENDPNAGFLGLAKNAAGTFFDAVTNKDSENRDRVLEAGAGGARLAALMGGAETIGNAAITHAATSYNAKRLFGNDPQGLVQVALEVNPDSALANKLQTKLDGGKKITGTELAKLIGETETTTAEQMQSAVGSVVEQRLSEVGETGDTALISRAIVKKNMGEELNVRENRALNQSSIGDMVLRELKSGEIFDNVKSENSPGMAQEAAGQENGPVKGEQPIRNLEGKEIDAETSEDGKTRIISTGQELNIKDIDSIKDGKITFKMEDDSLVDASDIQYASEDEAIIYDTVASMGVVPAQARVLVKGFVSGNVPANVYAKGMQDAYLYGKWGVTRSELGNGHFTSRLTQEQRESAYEVGRITAEMQTKAEQAKKEAARGTNTEKQPGKVHYEGDRTKLTQAQQTNLKALDVVAETLGVQIHVFESQVGADGKRIGANGRYDTTTGEIYIDLYAGADGKGTMLFTAAHELTHFIRQESPAKFKALSDFLMEQYGKKGVPVQELVENQLEKARKANVELDYDGAFEEVVADSMESMLTDGKVIQELKQQDKGLWNRVKKYVEDLCRKIREVYKKLKPDSFEGQTVAKMRDAAEEMRRLFAEGLQDAAENYQGAEKNTTREGDVKMQIRTANGNDIVWIEDNIMKENKGEPTHQFIANYIAEHIGEVYTIIESGQGVYIGKDLPGEYTQSKYTTNILKNNSRILKAKNRAAASLGEMIEIGTNRRWEKTKHPNSKDAKYGMYRYDTRFGFPVTNRNGEITHANVYNAELLIRNASDGKKYLYDIVNIKKDTASSALMTDEVTRAEAHASAQKSDVSKNSIRESSSPVKPKFENIAESQQFKRWFGDWKKRPQDASKVVNSDGTPMVVYHQTGNEFTVFDPKHSGAGSSDQQTPFGIFLKTSSKDIGVKGKKQMALYANIRNPLRAVNRSDLTRKLKQLSADYAALCEDYDNMNLEFQKKQEDAGKKLDEYMLQWRKENPAASRRDIYEDETFNRLSDAEDDIITLWEQEDQKLSTKAKTAITKALRDAGYDGVFLSDDTGSWGRKTDAIIALDPEQVKSATDNVGTFDKSNPDIRYSLRDQDVRKMNDVLEKQNEKLREDVTSLKELLKLQKSVTGGKLYKDSSLTTAAKYLMENTGAKGDVKEFKGLLRGVYDYIAGGEEISWDGIMEKAEDSALWLEDHMEKKTKRDPYADDVLREIKGGSFYLDEQQKQEAAYQYGSVNDFRKGLFGRLNVSDNSSMSLDSWWSEQSALHPDIFDPNISSSDMPGALMDALDSLKGMTVSDQMYDQAGLHQDLLQKIYDGYWRLSTLYTVADVKQKQINELKGKHKARMEEVNEDHKKVIAKLKAEHKADVKNLREDLNKKAEKKINAVKNEYNETKDALKATRKDVVTLENEFVRAVKAYEKQADSDMKRYEEYMGHWIDAYENQANMDSKTYEKEINRLMKEYEKTGKKANKLEAELEQRRQAAKEKIDSRASTVLRNQIKGMAGTFQKMLTSPKKGSTQHVPVRLASTLAKFCDLFAESQELGLKVQAGVLRNRTAAMEQNAAMLNEDESLHYGIGADKLSRKSDAIARESDIIARKNAQIVETQKRLAAMREAYAELKSDSTDGLAYNEVTEKLLTELEKELAGKDILNMTRQELEMVKKTMDGMMHAITDANKMFVDGKEMGLIETGTKFAKDMTQAVVNHNPVSDALRGYWMKQMTPDVFFKFLGGYVKNGAGEILQRMFVEGETRMLGVQRDFYNQFKHLTESENKQERKEVFQLMKNPTKQMVDIGMKDRAGNSVKFTRGMMMQLYMLLSQNDSLESISRGGLKLPKAREYYNGDMDKAYSGADIETLYSSEGSGLFELSEEMKKVERDLKAEGLEENVRAGLEERLREVKNEMGSLAAGEKARLLAMRDSIENQLTATEKKCIETAKAWYAYSGKLMGDVFESMYGYRPMLVENYVPIHRDETSVKMDLRVENGEINLEDSGFTKERQTNYKPIKLTDFFTELNRQQNAISRYYGFAEAQRNFNRIWNMQIPGTRNTIKGMVAAKFGDGKGALTTSGVAYVENYIADIAGGNTQENVLSSFYGRAASATLSLNPRVAFSQLASIPTAAAEIGWKNMAVGFFKGLRTSFSTKRKNELAQKSVYFFQRYRGEGGITEIADLKAHGGIWDKVSSSGVGKALFNWCQNFDVFATASMWSMAEEQVKSSGMKPGSEGYQAAVEQVYENIIRKTQPNYTVTERSDLLRDKRGGMKLVTMYKTQSNQNLNILMSANMEFNKMKRDLRDGRNGVTQADVKAAGKRLLNSATAVIIGGQVFFVGLRTMINFVTRAVNGYRDDDTDEVTWEETWKAMVREMLSSMAGIVTLGSEVYDLLESIVLKENYYGITDSALAQIVNLAETSVDFVNTLRDEDGDLKGKWKSAGKEVESFLNSFGAPASNARKLGEAVDGWVRDIKNGTPFAYSSGKTTDNQYRARFLNAYRNGDKEKCADVVAYLLSEIDEPTDARAEKKLQSGFKDFLKDRYLDEKVTEQEVKDILHGYLKMDMEDVDAALNKWKGESETGNTLEDMKDSYLRHEVSGREYIDYLKKYGGKTQEQAEKAKENLDFESKYEFAKDDRKEAYLSGQVSRQSMKQILIKEWEYKPEDADNQITAWEWEHDGIEGATKARVKTYNEHCRAAGVPVEVYMEVTRFDANTENDKDENGKPIKYTAVKKIMAKINSMQISASQKDAIANCFGWKENTINKYRLW